MTDQDKITAITNAILGDNPTSNTVKLMQHLIVNNLPNVSSMQLEMIMQLLEIPES